MKNYYAIVILLLNICCSYTEEKSENIDGMVLIPSGSFRMGGKSDQAERDEFPVRGVEVSSFYLDATEVTNRQFEQFVAATNYQTVAERAIDWEELKKQLPSGTPKPPDSVLLPGSLVFKSTNARVNLTDYSQWWVWKVGANWKHPEGPTSHIQDRMNHPVVHIAYEDALSYAKWAKKRLPTEAEWEWASRGGVADAKYPWGNSSLENAFSKANFWQGIFPSTNLLLDGYFGTSPVKSFPPNGYGLYDMAGNVWEICQDKYHAIGYGLTESNVINPLGPNQSYDPREPYLEKHVTRGGSYLCNESYCSGYRASRRMSIDKDSGLSHTGFRCAKDVKLIGVAY